MTAQATAPAAASASRADLRTVVVERELPHPPQKVWRAISQQHLLQEWLMSNDFRAEVGHRFRFTADWGAVEGEVLSVEPGRSLSYGWNAMGLESVVTWTLAPTASGAGTTLRMEQHGFRPDQEQAFQGAKYGWNQFFGKLEQLLAREDRAA